MIELLVKAAVCYALGSIVGSLIVAGLIGGADIRNLGSGNAGATNALRTQGKAVALAVLVIDLGKGWLATRLVAPAILPWLTPPLPAWQAWSIPACALAVMLGHVWPVWFGFRGGKGVATLVGAALGIEAWLLVPMVLTFLVFVMLLGYVSVGSLVAALALAIASGWLVPRAPLVTFGILALLLVVFTHRGNLARVRAGTEPRAKRLWLFAPRAPGRTGP